MCVANVYGCVTLVVCARVYEECYDSPVAASEQEPKDLASSLVLFFC